MSNANQYLPFGTGGGANTYSYAAYSAMANVALGNQPGLADAQFVNTTLRQVSVAVAALAQLAADLGTHDVLDNGSVTDFKVALESALVTKGAGTSFESAEQTVPNVGGTLVSIAHGQATPPKSLRVILRCKSTEGGWSVGDELDWNPYDNGATDRIMTFGANATNVFVLWQSVSDFAPGIRDHSSTSLFTLDPAKWALVFRATWI